MAGGFETSGFVLPENNFAGLYKTGDDLAAANKAAALKKEDDDKAKLAGQRYFQNQFKNKELITGTANDQAYGDLYGQATSQANELLSKGVDVPTVQMAVQPLLDQASIYSVSGKDFKLKNDQANKLLADRNDINKEGFNKEVMNNAFPIDPKTGRPDLTKYDQNKNYWDEALSNGENVYNSNGVKKFFQGFKSSEDNNVYKVTNSDGTSTYTKNALSYPSFMQPIEDPVKGFVGFEPKHEIATDDNNTLLHKYGEQAGQPVKLLSEDVWNTMPSDNKAYYVQQVRNHIKGIGSKTPLDSQQAEYYARALAYDDANTFGQSNTKKNFSNQNNKFNKYDFAAYNNRLKQKLYDYESSGGEAAANQGNVLDLFGATSPIRIQSGTEDGAGGQILNGVVYDKNGDVKKGGQIKVKREDLPAEFTNVIKSGSGQKYIPEFTIFDIGDDGKLKAAHLPSGVANRQQINDFQTQIQVSKKGVQKKTFGLNTSTEQPKQQPAKTEIKSSDISSKAKAAGYTEKEYRSMLIKNGVKIID